MLLGVDRTDDANQPPFGARPDPAAAFFYPTRVLAVPLQLVFTDVTFDSALVGSGARIVRLAHDPAFECGPVGCRTRCFVANQTAADQAAGGGDISPGKLICDGIKLDKRLGRVLTRLRRIRLHGRNCARPRSVIFLMLGADRLG